MRRSISTVLVLCCLIFCANPCSARIIKGATVKKIIDGDTILVATGSETVKVRLWGIDTPEYHQPFSKVAKKYTGSLLQYSSVDLVVKDWDDYGRMVALVQMADGRTANEELVKSGYAWVHIYYCKETICQKWNSYEKQARLERRGLWRDSKPVAPWIWKRNHRKKR